MNLPDDVFYFLIAKAPVQLRGTTCDQMVERVDVRYWRCRTSRRQPLNGAVRCGRPIWGDGEIDGVPHGMCSSCWHNSQMFRGGKYLLFRANAAAENLADMSNALRRLGVGSEHAPLFEAPAEPVFDPIEWEQREDWDEAA